MSASSYLFRGSHTRSCEVRVSVVQFRYCGVDKFHAKKVLLLNTHMGLSTSFFLGGLRLRFYLQVNRPKSGSVRRFLVSEYFEFRYLP